MTDILNTIDAALEEVEEQLLVELDRFLGTTEPDQYCVVDPGIKQALADVIDELHTQLENSGDRSNLQLVTKRHEIMYARMAVLRQLLAANIAVAILHSAHDGVEARRKLLERRALIERNAVDPSTEPVMMEIPLEFREPSTREIERNRYGITWQEQQRLGANQDRLDNGIYSASRELATLARLSQGLPEAPIAADLAKERAVFKSRDLSQPRGRLKRRPEPEPKPAPHRRDIAQTPEEIRRKLEARRNTAGGGKAVFSSKDLSHAATREAPTQPAAGQDQRSASTGKAVFAARDIEPAMPHEHYGRKRREEEKDKEPDKSEKPRGGRAVFEARDLSNAPFHKKDS